MMMNRSAFMQCCRFVSITVAILATTGALASTITVTTLNDVTDFGGSRQVSDLWGRTGR